MHSIRLSFDTVKIVEGENTQNQNGIQIYNSENFNTIDVNCQISAYTLVNLLRGKIKANLDHAIKFHTKTVGI